MADPGTTPVPWRVQGAIYGAGLFANSSLQLYGIVVPLWIVTLHPSPFMIGVTLGSRQVLPMLFSIHAGALMDRLGARRVMLVLAAASMAIPPLYPLLPSMGPLIVLQMLGGFTVMMCWVGAQSFIGHVTRGNPIYAGRLTMATRIGVFAGPPLVGLIWDTAGPWGAFGFMTFWAAGAFVSTLLLPARRPDGAAGRTPRRAGLAGLLPDVRDYAAAFRLLGVPAIALVVAATSLRHAGTGMQSSFYVVYLHEIGIRGTAIGTLFSVMGVCGGVTSLAVGRLARWVEPRTLLLSSVALSVLIIAITPLLGTFLVLLVAIGARGMVSGVAQSMEMALTAQHAGADAQGKAAALRLTIGRVAAVITPILMGGIVQLFGLAMGFYLVGGTILAILLWLGLRRVEGNQPR